MDMSFNKFDQFEPPVLVLCAPNKDELYALPFAEKITNVMRYNALSELTFSYSKSRDGGVTTEEVYDYIKGKMLVLIPDVGYYIIQSCPEDCTGAVPVKNVSCYSLEAELLTPRVTGFDGTYDFYTLLRKVLTYKPTWTIDTIDASLLTLYRTFTGGNNTTAYNFLMVDMEKAYGCVFEFNTFTRTVSAIANVIPSANTNAYLSFDNLIKRIEFKEITQEICTAMYCYGGGSLDIHNVNPLGGTVIYDFSYFKTTDWMSQDLIDALEAWETKVAAYQTTYSDTLERYLELDSEHIQQMADLTDMIGQLKSMLNVREARIAQELDTTAIDAEITAQKILIKSQQVTIENTLANENTLMMDLRKIVHDSYFTSRLSFYAFETDTTLINNQIGLLQKNWSDTYNTTTDYPYFDSTTLTNETENIVSLFESAMTESTTLNDTITAEFSSYPITAGEQAVVIGYINNLIDYLNSLDSIFEGLIPATIVTETIDEIVAKLTSYLEIVTYSGNMTYAEYLELVPYIYENTYTNENIITTDIMTPTEIQEQSQALYDQSVDVLEKVAQPRYEFSGEFSNFVMLKEFADFTTDLELGTAINIKKDDDGALIQAILLEISINYSDPTDFNMTFSNRFRLDNSRFIYADLLGSATQGNIGSSASAITQGSLGGWTVGSGGMSIPTANISSAGYISFGDDPPTEYGNYIGTWLGYNSAPKFSLFANTQNYLQWDGSKLLVRAENFTLDAFGNINATNAILSGTVTAAKGAIGGWIIDATSLYSAQSGNKRVILDSTGRYISFGTTPPTSYGNNAGAWLGYDGVAKISLYTDANNYLQWNGTKLVLKGTNFELDTSTGGTIAGWTISTNNLSSGSGATTVGIDTGGTNPAFYAGSATPATAPFRVYNDGSVWLEDAHIYGDMESVPYLEGVLGWKIEKTGHAEFNDIKLRGNIQSVVFAKTQINTISGQVYVTDGAVLVADASSTDTTLYFDANAFYKGDVIHMSNGTQQEWMTVTDDGTGIDDYYAYTVVRDIGGHVAVDLYAGEVLVRAGSSTTFESECIGIGTIDSVFGEFMFGASPVVGFGGFLDLNGGRGEAPYFGVWRRTGSTWDDLENIARFGNLNGWLSYTDEIYGIGIGDTNRHLIYTYTDGLEIVTSGGDTTIDENGISTSALVASLNRVLTEDLTVEDTKCFIVSDYLDAGAYDIYLVGDATMEIL